MYKWLASFKLEIKMIFTNWFLLALPILFGIWFALDLAKIAPPRSEDIYHFAYDFHKVKQTLSLGVAMFLGILSVRRDLRKPTYDWLGSLPVSSATSLISKYAAGLVYLTLFVLAMSAVFAWFAYQREMTAEEIWDYLAFYGLQYEWSYGVTLALAMSLAVFIKNRISYLIGFCAWMFGTFFMDIFIISRNNLFFLKTFHLSQFLLNSFMENEVWGIRLLAKEIWLSRIFVIAFILMLITIMIAVLKGVRPSRSYKRWIGFSMVALIFAGAAFVPYGMLWQERYHAFAEKVKDAVTIEDREVVQNFPIRAYDIEMKLNPNGEVEVSAILQIPEAETRGLTQLPFTLNRMFKVKEALADDQRIGFSQKGDIVTLDLTSRKTPSELQTITLRYAGKVDDWHYRSGLEYFNAYADQENLYLPAEIAWYPLAGERVLYINDHGTGRYNLTVNPLDPVYPSDFTVKVKGFKRKVYSTLAEEKISKEDQEQQGWVFVGEDKAVSLYSGDLVEVKVADQSTTVITAPSNRVEAERYLARLSAMKKYYASWVEQPLHEIDRIFYSSPFGNSIYEGKLQGTQYFIYESQFHNLDESQIIKAINRMLFQDLETQVYFSDNPEDDENFSIVSEIRLVFYYLYGRDALHLTHQETISNMRLFWDAKEKRFSSPLLPNSNPYLAQILEEIDQAIAAGKLEKVKEVLNHFRSEGLTLDLSNPQQMEYPRITMADWQRVWEKVMQQ